MGGSGRPPNPPTLGGTPAKPGSPSITSPASGWPPKSDLGALLAVLQFADGVFPSGGFAHSFGLETYAQSGAVRDAAGLADFVRAHLEGSAGPADAVAVAQAARAGHARDADACLEIDRRLDAMKAVPEFRAASRQMGRQTARAAAAVMGEAFLQSLAAAVDDDRMPGHHAVVFGAVTGCGGASAETAAAAFLHSTAALLVGAGLRLLPIGQIEGQQVLAAIRPRIARLATRAAAVGVDDMWSFTPGLEVAGLRHVDLEGRLFRS
jgi:urease accessory protein